MKNSKITLKKWTDNETVEWGDTKVEFFIKDSSILFGNLKVPPQKNTPVDEGHPNGEYVFIKDGTATVVFSKDNSEISRSDLKKGEAMLIPSNIDHQTFNSKKEELSIIFFINLE